MKKQIITFSASEQTLTRTGGEQHYSSNKVSYIEARFSLGTNWDGFDSVRAVWFTDFVRGISTVLDPDGSCIVPAEVLRTMRKVNVNLVGSIVDGDVLTDRLTSYPVTAFVVDANAKVDGTETAEITPSQFEQFVGIVRDEVAEVTGMTATAETLPAGSDATASYEGGVLTFGIPRGEAGESGADGFSPIVTVTEITGGHNVSIEDATQTQTFDVMDGATPAIPWDSILPVDTASGSIASFPDGTDLVPAKSVKVTLDPIQDLHGYDKPWSGGNGKNKVNYLACVGVGTRDNSDSVDASVSISSDVVTLTGYASYASGGQIFKGIGSPSITGAFTVSADVKCTASEVAFGVGAYEGGGTSDVNTNYDVTANTWTHISRTFTDKTYAKIGIFLQPKAATAVLEVKNLQLEEGSTATSYAPYSNICPISGHDGVEVTRTGKNLIPYPYRTASGTYSGVTYFINSDGTVNLHGTATATVFVDLFGRNTTTISYLSPLKSIGLKAGDTITLSSNYSERFLIQFNKADGTLTKPSSIYIDNGVPTTATIPSDAKYCYIAFRLVNGTSVNQDNIWFMIQKSSTASDYEPYQSDTYSVSFASAGTVYGGDVEVVGGQLTDKMGMVDLGTLNWQKVNVASPYFQASYSPAYKYEALQINFLCSHYSHASIGSSGSTEGIFLTDGNYIRIRDLNYTSADATAFKTAMSGVQLVYELEQPQTYQLTPTEVDLLLGQNNVWSDGDVEVVYNADIQRYIEKRTR